MTRAEHDVTAVDRGCWLVMEGDWGGQVYLTVPTHLVPGLVVQQDGDFPFIVRAHKHIWRLLRVLDACAWSCNDGEGTGMYIHVCTDDFASQCVSGGMGGGELTEGLWLHNKLLARPAPGYWQQRAANLLGCT